MSNKTHFPHPCTRCVFLKGEPRLDMYFCGCHIRPQIIYQNGGNSRDVNQIAANNGLPIGTCNCVVCIELICQCHQLGLISKTLADAAIGGVDE